ncbi:MAG: hypothetical protein K2Q45_02515 [Nitrosomonas sp.]|nr:hypothetical protein [Nitrosomonas sp.]
MSTVVEKLQKIARAKNVQIAHIKMQEQQFFERALQEAQSDRAMALPFVNLGLNLKKQRLAEIEKYAQITLLIKTIETAQCNVGIASTFFQANQTLQQVLASMPANAAEIMKNIRLHVAKVERNDRMLSMPVQQQQQQSVDNVVLEQELDELMKPRLALPPPQAAAAAAVVTEEKSNTKKAAVLS